MPLFLDVDEEMNSGQKKKTNIYTKPRKENSKDEVWKHIWKLFINKLLKSDILKKVVFIIIYRKLLVLIGN